MIFCFVELMHTVHCWHIKVWRGLGTNISIYFNIVLDTANWDDPARLDCPTVNLRRGSLWSHGFRKMDRVVSPRPNDSWACSKYAHLHKLADAFSQKVWKWRTWSNLHGLEEFGRCWNGQWDQPMSHASFKPKAPAGGTVGPERSSRVGWKAPTLVHWWSNHWWSNGFLLRQRGTQKRQQLSR